METIKKQMKSKFLQVSMGVSLMLFAAGFFALSINHAAASAPDKFPTPDKFVTAGDNTLGKYAAQFTVVSWKDGSNRSIVQVALIYDTQTGKSVLYESDNAEAWFKEKVQLPSSPLQ
ncbi:MAG: hypothetical protein ACYDCN_05890 [Bacteroidia bacterium]